MNKRLMILAAFTGLCVMAATPIYSTKVNEMLESMLSKEGRFTQIITADGGCTVTGNLNVAGTLKQNNYDTPVIIVSDYLDATMTGTTSTQLATFTLPGGLMRTEGCLDVYVEFEFADTSGQKAIDCYTGIDGVNTDLFGLVNIGTTTVGYSGIASLINKGSTTANLIKRIWRGYGANATAASLLTTGTIDTSVDATFGVYANNVAPATGTITLHYLRVVCYPGGQ